MTRAAPDASPRRLESAAGRFFMTLLGVVLILTALLVLIRPQDANVDYRQVWVAVSLIVALGAASLLNKVVGPWTRHRGDTLRALGSTATSRSWRPWVLATAGSIAGGVGAVLLALPLRYDYGWDAGVVTRFSRELSSQGMLSAYAQDYLSRYPNNVPLVAIMNWARSLGGGSDAGMYDAFVWTNGLCLAVVLLLCFVLVRLIRGTRAAFVAQGLVFALVGCSPWMAVPYTDFPAMPFVIGAVVLAVGATRTGRLRSRVLLAALAFALVGVAFVIKATPATTAVAFVLVLLVLALGRSRRSAGSVIVACIAGLAAFGVSVTGTLALADGVARVSRAELDTSRTAPTTWWLANGLTTSASLSGRPYYGGYSPSMVKQSINLSGDTLQAWSDSRLRGQLRTMGPVGVLTFEVNKQTFNWGDGMFFAWGEGYDFEPNRLHEHGALASAVQSVQHSSGSHYQMRASLTNGLWLALLVWAGVGLVRARYRRELLVLALTVLGITAFTLLFQGRSRYLFAYVPVVLALAAVVDPLRPVSPLRWVIRGKGRTRGGRSADGRALDVVNSPR